MPTPTEVWPNSSQVDALDGTTDAETGLPYIAKATDQNSTPDLAEQYQRRENRQNKILALANALRVVKVGDDDIGCFGGRFRIGTNDYLYSGESSCANWPLTAISDGTWYVYATALTDQGNDDQVQVDNAWPTDLATFIPLAIVTRASSAITAITDARSLALLWASGSAAGAATGTDEAAFILDEDNVGGAGVNTQIRFRRGTSGNDAAIRHVNASNKFQAIANEGTGALAPFEASTLKSDVATGTAPLTVASTTAVANLNSDTVDGLHAGTPVEGGIGYADGSSTLQFTAVGTSGDVLVSAGTGTPLWKTLVNAGIQALASILTAISALATTGFISRTGAGTVATRTLTGSGGIGVTNGDGVSGNPVIAVSGMTENGVMIGDSAGGADSLAEGADNTVLCGRTGNTPTFRKVTEDDIDSGSRIEFSKIARGSSYTMAGFDINGVLDSVTPISVSFNIGAESANVIIVTIGIGDMIKELTRRNIVELWLCDSASGGGPSATAADSFYLASGDLLETITASKWIRVIPDSSDEIVLHIEKSGAKTWYLVVNVRGTMFVSSAITFAA